ncbi:hypothetical protein [Paraburkholderia edwinii]|jgi:hypothetical protein|uniref:hypothetical protein n=1 Tax=Paraburkholderia edwinii TaxID=2861782 RepID=UPI003CCED4A8
MDNLYATTEAGLVDRGEQWGATVTPTDVTAVFEQLNLEGRATVDLDHACAGLAAWLAGAWDRLGEEEIALLTSVGATLWREGHYKRRY